MILDAGGGIRWQHPFDPRGQRFSLHALVRDRQRTARLPKQLLNRTIARIEMAHRVSYVERSGTTFLPAGSGPSTSARSSAPGSLTTASKQSVT